MSSITLDSTELALAVLNAQINGSTGVNVDAALSAIRSRTDEINICGTPCPGTCSSCVQAHQNLQAFYAPEAPSSEPIEVQVMAPAGDDEEQQAWEDQVMAARALDEAEEVTRTGMWADFDAPDNRDLDEDDDDDVSFDSYDDRQDDYYDDWNTGLDWNEGGYFD